MPQTMTQRAAEPIDSPAAWFAALERARLTGDWELAQRAKGELKRLGVTVIYDRPRRRVVVRTKGITR